MLTIQDISKKFSGLSEKIIALDTVSFVIEKGSICGLVGPNGAGKSTLIRIILGIERPDSGHIEMSCNGGTTGMIGYVPERPTFYNDLTGSENLLCIAKILRIEDPERACDVLLRRFGLFERRTDPVTDYSKGMRQRLAIARAMLNAPKFLIMDEPFSGLDPSIVMDLRAIIQNITREGDVTLLLSSHDLNEIQEICDEIVFMKRGRVMTKIKLDDAATAPVFQICLAKMPMDLPGLLGDLGPYELDGNTLRVGMDKDSLPALLSSIILNGGQVAESKMVKKSVEELYREIIMSKEEDQ